VINRLKERVKIRLRRALANPAVSDEPLAHVVVAGGSLEEWSSFGASDWSRRISALVDAVEPEGVKWLTLVPLRGREASPELSLSLEKAMRHQRGRVQVIVRSDADGRKRFAEVVDRLHRDEQLVGVHATTSEGALARALLAPADVEPDLVVVLGPPDTLPTSLVWELAYSEIVFLDIPWSEVTSEHVQMAVDDFRRRNRRFGGIDA
jgi:undecaprenyl diphosphate synthase